MDLANYRVSGAAPRLLRTKAEWDEEEEDGEIGGRKIFRIHCPPTLPTVSV